MARLGGNMESLMLALGRKARTCSPTTRFEDLHNVTLDYVMIGLETETICALLKQFNDTEVPIHHLPDKVIFRIFEAFWGTYEELSYQWLLITVVCKRWRSVALSCPRLWSVLHFDVMPLEAASRFVELSSDVPMKWIIPNYKRLEQRHEDFHAKFSDLLASSMNRIEHLDIDLGGHNNFLDLLEKPASKLKYLRICGKAPVPKVKTDETLLPALNTAPRLQHFILESDISWARTPLKRLISFISVWQNFGDSSSTSTFLQTLRKSPSLSLLSLGTMQNGVDLELALPPSSIEYRVDQSKIHLSNIGKVVLTYMSLHSLRRLTSMIKAPESTNSVIGMTTSNGTPAVLVDVFLSFPVPIPEPGHVILLINKNPSIYRYNVIIQDNGDTLPPRFWHRNVFSDTSALLSDSRLAGALSLTIHYPRPFTTAMETHAFSWEDIIPRFSQLCTIRVFNENPISVISPLLAPDQGPVLEALNAEIRSTLVNTTCTEGHYDAHVHFAHMIGVTLCGEPALAQIECGCRPSLHTEENDMYVLTVIVKGNGTPGYSKEKLCRWLVDTWTGIVPLKNDDIQEMVHSLNDMP